MGIRRGVRRETGPGRLGEPAASIRPHATARAAARRREGGLFGQRRRESRPAAWVASREIRVPTGIPPPLRSLDVAHFNPVWRRSSTPSYACTRGNATRQFAPVGPISPVHAPGRLPWSRRGRRTSRGRKRRRSVSAAAGTDGPRCTGPTVAGSRRRARSRSPGATRGPREPSPRPRRTAPPRHGPPRAC